MTIESAQSVIRWTSPNNEEHIYRLKYFPVQCHCLSVVVYISFSLLVPTTKSLPRALSREQGTRLFSVHYLSFSTVHSTTGQAPFERPIQTSSSFLQLLASAFSSLPNNEELVILDSFNDCIARMTMMRRTEQEIEKLYGTQSNSYLCVIGVTISNNYQKKNSSTKNYTAFVSSVFNPQQPRTPFVRILRCKCYPDNILPLLAHHTIVSLGWLSNDNVDKQK